MGRLKSHKPRRTRPAIGEVEPLRLMPGSTLKEPPAPPKTLKCHHHGVTVFNPLDPWHFWNLRELYRAYVLDEFDRTGETAPGVPLAEWLTTALLWEDGRAVGFVSIDTKRAAVELLYVHPEHRRTGKARFLFAVAEDCCAAPVAAKGPITPAGRALIDALGMPEHPETPEDIAEREAKTAELRVMWATTTCEPHQTRDCPDCHRVADQVTADTVLMMGQQVLARLALYRVAKTA
ncbi:GNAT family N-acetyltransferase [Streptomyces olivaceus]|uniref:GNAT family N-acetyltransferase n=1 Tax=Streptomyces olivaceus TaxID=47716 RepID=UPI001CCAFF2B|nr:GNAT family N-acetyltransferase [Streptomyces olivaceus]MBZ6252185.1 GNAT family N-acetyltransferase [Streptomyces olivaceus]